MLMEILDMVMGLLISLYLHILSIIHLGETTHNRDEEIMDLLKKDINDESDETKVW